MKNENHFKVYALDFENFTRLACKSVTVYLSDIQRQTQHFISYEITVSGWNETGQIVEMVIDCGGGFTVERGRVSDKPVFAKFELEGLEGGAR